jgi:alpha/beta superfamily hydrolase
MHNKVVFRAAKAAQGLGLPTLLFNFRGVGKSPGRYNEGHGEREDLRAALDFLGTRFPATRICLMGFSFGAWVGFEVGASRPRVEALVGIGPPVTSLDFDFLRNVRKPKLWVQGTRDEFGPRARVEALFASLPEPKRLRWIEGADHFFTGKLPEVQSAIRSFLIEILAQAQKNRLGGTPGLV